MSGLRDYSCNIAGYEGAGTTVAAANASKARYSYWLGVRDCCPDLRLIDVRVHSLGPHQRPLCEIQADLFNALYPIGTLVRYWTGLREGLGCISRTRSNAHVVGGHASVWMEQQTGCVCLSHVEVLAVQS